MLTTVELPTRDGACRTSILTPESGTGPWPGVIFCIDGGGPRHTLDEMAQRIANGGYVVAEPDLFHRVGSVFDLLPEGMPKTAKSLVGMFGNTAFREKFRSTFYASATNEENLRADIGAVLSHFKTLPSVRPGAVGTTGYCMGGNISLRLAGLFGSQVGVATSFHGGGLATPAPDSPHLGASAITATFYAGCAVDDPTCTDEMKATLAAALTQAKVEHTIETYPGAKHGFAVHDTPAFNAEAAERHYAVLERLFAKL